MPAMPMNDAAERYSPEMAEAFQPTETERPATKKSPAVFEVRADQKPIPMVATTVMKEKAKTQPSKETEAPNKSRWNISVVQANARGLDLFERDRSFDEVERDHPNQ